MDIPKIALIMAGGVGQRLWPKSRGKKPKQFLVVNHAEKTLLQSAVARVGKYVGFSNVFVATNNQYRCIVQEQLPDITPDHIICEPLGRNTAACIGFGAVFIQKYFKRDAVMIVVPSDQIIKNDEGFISAIDKAGLVAEKADGLITIGIPPQYPETGYGYIHFDRNCGYENVYHVHSFIEKPLLEDAIKYCQKEDYLWNSGVFACKISKIIASLQEFLPTTYYGLMKIQAALGTTDETHVLREVFVEIPSISIDHAILEKSNEVYTLPGNFVWDDAGSWLSFDRNEKLDEHKNALQGDVVVVHSEHCIVENSNQGNLLVVVGIQNALVIQNGNVTLVCSKNNVGDINEVLEKLKHDGKEEFL